MTSDFETERRAGFERELRHMEQAWRAGVADALTDAVAWCECFGEPPPRWVSQGVLALVAGHVGEQKGPGRLGNVKATRRQDMIHFARWDAVTECRDRKGQRGIPTTWPECYAAVSEMFVGTEAEGAEETMKASYQLVARRMREGDDLRYYIPWKKPG